MTKVLAEGAKTKANEIMKTCMEGCATCKDDKEAAMAKAKECKASAEEEFVKAGGDKKEFAREAAKANEKEAMMEFEACLAGSEGVDVKKTKGGRDKMDESTKAAMDQCFGQAKERLGQLEGKDVDENRLRIAMERGKAQKG